MYKYFFCLVFLVLAKVVAAQTLFFNKMYQPLPKYNFAESIKSVLVLPDGYLLSGVGSEYPFIPTNAAGWYCFKTDTMGNIVWQKEVIKTSYKYLGGGLLQMPEGYLMYQTIKTFKSDDYGLHLIHIGTNGDVLWEKQIINENLYSSPCSIKHLEDGNLIVAGFTRNWVTEKLSDGYIAKLDTSGSILWEKKYGTAEYSDSFNEVLVLADGSLLMAGRRVSTTGKSQVWVLHTDSLGEKISQKYFGMGVYDAASQIIPAQKGGYWLAGISYPDYTYKSDGDAALWHIDSLLKVDFDTIYPRKGSDSFVGIHENLDGSLHLFGSDGQTDTGNGRLVKLSSNGTVIWDRSYSPDGLINERYDYLWDFAPTPDGGYVLCGQGLHTQSNIQDGWVFKVDSLGNTCFTLNCDSIAYPLGVENSPPLEEQEWFSLSPNPAQQQVTVSLPAPPTTPQQLQVYDATGREVQTHLLTQQQTTISTANLPQGIYYLCLQGHIESVKLVVLR